MNIISVRIPEIMFQMNSHAVCGGGTVLHHQKTTLAYVVREKEEIPSGLSVVDTATALSLRARQRRRKAPN